MTSKINPLCAIYLDNYSIINAINTLNSILCSQTYKDLFVCLYMHRTAKNSRLVSNMLDKIHSQFSEFIDNNRLNIVVTDKVMDTIDIFQDPKNIKYNLFIPINHKNIYFKNYISSIVDFAQKNPSVDFIKVGTNQVIDSSGILHDKNISKLNLVLSKKALEKLKNIKYNDILNIINTFDYVAFQTEQYIEYIIGYQDRIILNEQNFKIVWLEENTDENKNLLKLNDSYIFIYLQNNKIFNINNNTHGIIKEHSDTNLKIDWFGNDMGFQEYSYELDANKNTFVNINP